MPMISSMTGHGEVQRSHDGVRYLVEIRTVNNRYYKSIIRLPEDLQFLELDIDKRLRERLSRGSITLHLKIRDETSRAAYDINHAALENYLDALAKAKPAKGIEATIDLATLSTLPGVCQPPDADDAEREKRGKIIDEMTVEAVEQVAVMRVREGRALHDDLMRQCKGVTEQLVVVVERAPGVIDEYHQRLTARVQKLTSENKLELDEDGLRREVAIYAERSDISEEITRLRTHIEHFGEQAERDGPVGRRLEFVAQEMLREVNTIGSKSNDSELARAVIEMKALVDRIKEQVQNVE